MHLPTRVSLQHTPPAWVQSGALFFVTISCRKRHENQLCRPGIGEELLKAVAFYHEQQDWFVRLFLLMPDHAHALLAPSPDKDLASLIGNWKRFGTTKLGIEWQKNFFDHRLRSDESWENKAAYIRQNPVRAGLVMTIEDWPYCWTS